MSRLPGAGGDFGTWGNILNDYLNVSHNSDGTLKTQAAMTIGVLTVSSMLIPASMTIGTTNALTLAGDGTTPVGPSIVVNSNTLRLSGGTTGLTFFSQNQGTQMGIINNSGQLAWGGNIPGGYLVNIAGTWSPTNSGAAAGLLVSTGINAAANQNAQHAIVSSSAGITKAGSGTHPTFATFWVDNLIVNAAAGALTNAYSFVVGGTAAGGSPTNVGTSWFSGAGANRFDSDGTAAEIILNRTAGGNAVQVAFTRSLVNKAYIGIDSNNDFTISDSGATARLKLLTTSSNLGVLLLGTGAVATGASTGEMVLGNALFYKATNASANGTINLIGAGSSNQVVLGPGSVIAIGNIASAASAAANDATMANAAWLRWSNAAGNNTIQGIRVNATDQVVLGGNATDIAWGKANVALGGGAAPTVGTIGGSGPAAAAQRNWLRFIESDGTASFIPVWR